jgi:putative ABC transport system permease protein
MSWLGEGPRSALQILVRYPGRSALTALGLAISVAAFIAMVSFGQGARRSVLAQFEMMGTNLLVVTTSAGERRGLERPVQPLTDLEVTVLRRESTTLAEVIPVARAEADAAREQLHHWTRLYGTTPAFTVLHEWPLTAGRMLEPPDVEQRGKVCVLGATPLRILFANGDPLGQVATIDGVLPCRVVGVLASKGYSASGDDTDDVILIPATTFNAYWGSPAGYTRIEAQPRTPQLMDAAMSEVAAILTSAHHIAEGQERDFKVSSPLEIVRAVDKTSAILGALLRGIAAVSLLVSGIGIMNIQLVSVTERTREIGVRAAIGASPRAILTQFLWEGLVLTFTGAAVGVGLGLAIASATAHIMEWPRVISLPAILGAVGFVLLVGLAFGFLPARQAARLDPIEALRHE